jgi:hypothetical protein
VSGYQIQAHVLLKRKVRKFGKKEIFSLFKSYPFNKSLPIRENLPQYFMSARRSQEFQNEEKIKKCHVFKELNVLSGVQKLIQSLHRIPL